MTGLFVTFEGIDGAGKSTQVSRLQQRWADQGREVVCTREPGGTALSESIRALLLQQDMDALTEALLMFAARRHHVQQVIEPALQRGAVVLCDRFTDASFAYQGGGRGLPLAVLSQLETWVQEGRQPDLTLWFDLSPQEAARRRGAVRAPDRFEQEDVAFFETVRCGYTQRWQQHPQRIARLDAEQPPEAVAQQIDAVLAARGWA